MKDPFEPSSIQGVRLPGRPGCLPIVQLCQFIGLYRRQRRHREEPDLHSFSLGFRGSWFCCLPGIFQWIAADYDAFEAPKRKPMAKRTETELRMPSKRTAKIFYRTPVLVGIALLATALGSSGETSDRKAEVSAPEGAGLAAGPSSSTPLQEPGVSPARVWLRGAHQSVQVNVDAQGNDIVGDSGSLPSIAIDPNDPSRMAVGFEQIDSIAVVLRQAGYGFSTDSGASWTAPGPLDPGVLRDNAVLSFDSAGNFYYLSEHRSSGPRLTDLFKSIDQGATWGPAVSAYGGNAASMAVDRSGGGGHGHIYTTWYGLFGCCGADNFSRSTDGGGSFEIPINAAPFHPILGSVSVGPNGEVVVVGASFVSPSSFALVRSTTAQDASEPVTFLPRSAIDLGGSLRHWTGPNPDRYLGQVWVEVNQAPGSRLGEIYVLCSVDPPGEDPMEVHFVRSTDDGATWSSPMRIHRDPVDNGAWQWSGTLSAAPNGRLDAVWNDTRNDPGGLVSEVYYSFSLDGGRSWSTGEPVSPPFDPLLGSSPVSNIGRKLGLVSRDDAVHLAYTASFNGEHDIYYLRIEARGLFLDGFESGDTSAWTWTSP